MADLLEAYGNVIDADDEGVGAFGVDRQGNNFILSNTHDVAYNPRQHGVFALHPLATPKYAKNVGSRDAEFRDTLARLYISLADTDPQGTLQQAYLASLPGDEATQSLAKVLLGSNSQGGTGFIDFFLTQASEQFQEIMQVDKVLSDDYVAFFYGQQPPVFQYSGVLLNSMQDDQRTGFGKAYQLMLRGTQMARRGVLARLRYDSVIVSGVMTSHSQQLNADNEMSVPFSFSFLVKEYVYTDNLPFSKQSAADYVKLAADSIIDSLGPVGAARETRVRTVAVTTPLPAGVSTAGAEQNTDVVNQDQNPAQKLVAKAGTASAKPSASSNVRGTIDPSPPSPPTPPSR